MSRSATIDLLRRIVSVRGDRLVVRTRVPRWLRGEREPEIWVAKSGPDPRAWHRKDLPDNRTPWRHGRLPLDECFARRALLDEMKRSIFARLAAYRRWTHSTAADEVMRVRQYRVAADFDERVRRSAAGARVHAEATARVVADEAAAEVRSWSKAWEGPDLEPTERQRRKHAWRLAVPESCPLRMTRDQARRLAPRPAATRYHRSEEELRYAARLRRRWLELDALRSWLARFPDGALDFVERHPFRERRWHLLNLWIRVPEGRQLFDEIPVLAFALASGWCFREGRERNLFRSIRRLVRRKRTEILRWLGFPAERRVLKFLKSLDPAEIDIRILLLIRSHLRDPQLLDRLTQLGVALVREDFFRISADPVPSLPMLGLMLAKDGASDADLAAQLFRDSNWMLGTLGGPGHRLHTALGSARSLRRLREVHDELSRLSRAEQERTDRRIKLMIENGSDFPVPLAGDLTILPLANPNAVLDEARAMDHCLHAYLHEIAAGRYFAYSVRLEGERATLGLEHDRRRDPPWRFDQLQGRRNGPVSDALHRHVEAWFRTARPAPDPEAAPPTPSTEQLEFPFADPAGRHTPQAASAATPEERGHSCPRPIASPTEAT